MTSPRPFSILTTTDQWSRAAFENTALINNVAQLNWDLEPETPSNGDAPLPAEGLCFDAHCRLFYTVRAQGVIRRLLWSSPDFQDVVVADEPSSAGDFSPLPISALFEPIAVAADSNERLFVADRATNAVFMFDLWNRRLLRRIALAASPIDLAVVRDEVHLLCAGTKNLIRLDTGIPVDGPPLPPGIIQASRVAASETQGVFILDRLGDPGARLLSSTRAPLSVPFATDIEFQTPDTLVVAREPSQDFARFFLSQAAVERIGNLKAKGYDGRGIVRTPDGRIGFLTHNGFRHAVGARQRFARSGRVTTFRFDAGAYQTTWGCIFLDACIPRDTGLRIHCAVTDEPPDGPTLLRKVPGNVKSMIVPRPDLSPPMPPMSLVPDAVSDPLYRRDTGIEIPWTLRDDNDRFETYEAPVMAGPGRFLWVTIEFTGNGLVTPMVRAVRVEHEAHDYLTRLPKVYYREDEGVGFLRRYLAMFDRALTEVDGRAFHRDALVDSRSTPGGFLPWLAGFLGLVIDERWSESVQRRLIENAIWLFRFRGTIAGLKLFLKIYLEGVEVVIVEKYQLRGLGGAMLGEPTAIEANSILGAGFRIGGATGVKGEQFLNGSAEDAFETHAHRFTVLIPAVLSSEQMDVIQHILDVHRPAHTLVNFCSVGAGMRVGLGLHIGISSMIGPSSGFETMQLGGTSATLGRGGILGRPMSGVRPSSSRIGKDTLAG
jgi:phage tail-like protein